MCEYTLYAKTDAELLGETFDERDHYLEIWHSIRRLGYKPSRWPSKIESVHTCKYVIKYEGRRDNDTPEETAAPDSIIRWVRLYLEAKFDDFGNEVPVRRMQRSDILDRIRMMDLHRQIIQADSSCNCSQA